MNPTRIGVRFAALLAAVFAAVLVFGSIGPSAIEDAQAAGGPALTGVSCADIYLDHINVGMTQTPVVKGTAPTTQPRVAKALSRTEPSQKNPGQWSVTTVSYLGPDQNGDLLPDEPPTPMDCAGEASKANGTSGTSNYNITVPKFAPAVSWNEVTVTVSGSGNVKSMSFVCRVGALRDNVAAGVQIPGGEQWTGKFNQACISPGAVPGVNLTVVWNGPPAGLLPCTVTNTLPGSNVGPHSCNVSTPVAKQGERNVVNDIVEFLRRAYEIYNIVRPIWDILRGLFPAVFNPGPNKLTYSGCTFSEALKLWIRTDSSVGTANQAPKTSNLGVVSVYVGTTSPTVKNDPSTCAITASTVGFHSISVVWNRTPTTDFNFNPPVKVLGIPDDPDGNSTGTHSAINPVVKFDPEVPDNDALADDWDGDGCTDWDELDKTFMINQFVPGSKDTWGRDPFNPNDCGPSQHNFTGAYSVLATAFPSSKQGVATPLLATVASVQSKVIKDGKHVQATVVVNSPNNLANNDEVFWNSTDPLQIGWWQVKYGGIGPGGVPAVGQKKVTMNRLFAPPCGLITTGLPGAPDDGLYGVNCLGPVQKGNYFHCISSIDDPKAPAPPAQRPLTSHILCYIDSPGLNDPGVAEVPSADGIGGSPPPPPYTTANASQLNGTFDPVTQQIFLRGCFENVGGYNPDPNVGDLAPNIVVETHLDAKSLKGFTNIWFHRTNLECAAKTPNGDPPSLQVETVLARQDIGFDHDQDGCPDYQELSKTPKKGCGDDPFNPFDSDNTLTNTGSVTVTVARADWNKVGAALLPGVFFDCATSATVAGAVVTIKAHCYTNSGAITINCEDTPGSNVKVSPATCTSGNTCPPANGVYGPAPLGGRCGDGSNGGGPRHDLTDAAPNNAGFGDVDSVANGGHTTLNGTIVGNNINFTGCFQNVENALQGPSIYVKGTIGLHGGQGGVFIYTVQTPANCKAGTPTGGVTLTGAHGAAAVQITVSSKALLNVVVGDVLKIGAGGASEEDVTVTSINPGGANTLGVTALVNAHANLETVKKEVLLEFAEQPMNFDHDRDNCATVDELGTVQTLGGLRDPQNHWDLRSVTTGVTATSQGSKNGSVTVADISAIVARFGGNDALGAAAINRHSDPKNNTTIPVPPAYHPQYDSGGGLVGSAGPWNVKGPDGAIAVGDISAIVAQFGHACPSVIP